MKVKDDFRKNACGCYCVVRAKTHVLLMGLMAVTLATHTALLVVHLHHTSSLPHARHQGPRHLAAMETSVGNQGILSSPAESQPRPNQTSKLKAGDLGQPISNNQMQVTTLASDLKRNSDSISSFHVNEHRAEFQDEEKLPDPVHQHHTLRPRSSSTQSPITNLRIKTPSTDVAIEAKTSQNATQNEVSQFELAPNDKRLLRFKSRSKNRRRVVDAKQPVTTDSETHAGRRTLLNEGKRTPQKSVHKQLISSPKSRQFNGSGIITQQTVNITSHPTLRKNSATGKTTATLIDNQLVIASGSNRNKTSHSSRTRSQESESGVTPPLPPKNLVSPEGNGKSDNNHTVRRGGISKSIFVAEFNVDHKKAEQWEVEEDFTADHLMQV